MTEKVQLSANIEKLTRRRCPVMPHQHLSSSAPVGGVTVAPRVYLWFTYWSQDSLSLTLH